MDPHHKHDHSLSAAGVLITLGIIFGDIGTSPLYVLRAIVDTRTITEDLILGGVSCIFWTLTLQTTLKYIVLTLRADNKGEGGIFALYTLVKRRKIKWLIFPAIIGGSALLGDGIITPAISVSAAVEGLREFNKDFDTIPIIIAIIAALFVIQQFGTKFIGKFFGPIMVTWFLMLAILGISSINENFGILKSLNPYYAYNLLVHYPKGFWILGAVFLCTTGAEALYSDLGHCGKSNIRVSWIFVKTALILNYMGQGAWLLNRVDTKLNGLNPFYEIVPHWFIIPSIIIATFATVVASQALISGSFTLVNEAMRLNLWPKSRLVYPTEMRGQLYIPVVNWLLMIGCIAVVLHFEESANMEAAYGLTIILGMLTTSVLMVHYMVMNRYKSYWVWGFIFTYFIIEPSFLFANLEKFPNGGWISLMIATFLMGLMWVMYDSRKIRNRYLEFVKVDKYASQIYDLSKDVTIPKYATHLVYLTSADKPTEIESKVIYSIMQKQPKRADLYWFVHVDVVDEPYKLEYKVHEIIHDDLIRVDFKLGFRVAPRINLMFRKVVQDMVRNGEVDIISRYESLSRNSVIGDFRFVVIEKFLSNENELSAYDKLILNIYFFIKKLSLSEEKAFGLDTSNVTVEKFPLILSPTKEVNLKRVY